MGILIMGNAGFIPSKVSLLTWFVDSAAVNYSRPGAFLVQYDLEIDAYPDRKT